MDVGGIALAAISMSLEISKGLYKVVDEVRSHGEDLEALTHQAKALEANFSAKLHDDHLVTEQINTTLSTMERTMLPALQAEAWGHSQCLQQAGRTFWPCGRPQSHRPAGRYAPRLPDERLAEHVVLRGRPELTCSKTTSDTTTTREAQCTEGSAGDAERSGKPRREHPLPGPWVMFVSTAPRFNEIVVVELGTFQVIIQHERHIRASPDLCFSRLAKGF